MHIYNLYGVSVTSDVSLLEDYGFTKPLSSLSEPVIEFRSLSNQKFPVCHQAVDKLEIAKGYKLSLYSDRGGISCDVGRPWRLLVKDIVQFSWIDGEPVLFYEILNMGSIQRMAYWCVHIVVPMFLAFTRGWHFFHAASVELNGGAVLLMARSHGGKSTLAHSAALRGARFLSDDKILVRRESGSYYVAPSHPYCRPDRTLESLGAMVPEYSDKPAPLLAVYCLEVSDNKRGIEICELSGISKLDQLLQHYLYSFRMQQNEQLEFLTGMISDVPVYILNRPWGIENISRVLETLEQHIQGLSK